MEETENLDFHDFLLRPLGTLIYGFGIVIVGLQI